jgi:hypothetical protein
MRQKKQGNCRSGIGRVPGAELSSSHRCMLRGPASHSRRQTMPNANRLTVAIMAMVAEEERRALSERANAAPRGGQSAGCQTRRPVEDLKNAELGRQKAAEARQAKAASRTGDLLPVIDAIRGGRDHERDWDREGAERARYPDNEGRWLAGRASSANAMKSKRISVGARKVPRHARASFARVPTKPSHFISQEFRDGEANLISSGFSTWRASAPVLWLRSSGTPWIELALVPLLVSS